MYDKSFWLSQKHNSKLHNIYMYLHGASGPYELRIDVDSTKSSDFKKPSEKKITLAMATCARFE